MRRTTSGADLHSRHQGGDRAHENIRSTRWRALCPPARQKLRDLTLALYKRAASKPLPGLDPRRYEARVRAADGRIVWIDEAFTPDSSRYWDAGQYAPGRGQPSFDKQFVRDWLDSTGWDKRPPAPKLPEGVVRTTREKYLDAYRKLTDSLPEHLEP